MADAKNAHSNGKETGIDNEHKPLDEAYCRAFLRLDGCSSVFDIRILTLRQPHRSTVDGWLSKLREDWLAQFWDYHAPTLGYASLYTFHHAAESNYSVLSILETLSNVPF